MTARSLLPAIVLLASAAAVAAAADALPPTTRPAAPAVNRALRPLPADVTPVARPLAAQPTPSPKPASPEFHPLPTPPAPKPPTLAPGPRLVPSKYETAAIRFPSTSLRPRQAAFDPTVSPPSGPAADFPPVATFARDLTPDHSAPSEPLPPPNLPDDATPVARPDLPSRARP